MARNRRAVGIGVMLLLLAGAVALGAPSAVMFVDSTLNSVGQFKMGLDVLPADAVYVQVLLAAPVPPGPIYVRLEAPATGDFIDHLFLSVSLAPPPFPLAVPPWVARFGNLPNPVFLIPASGGPAVTTDNRLEVYPGDLIQVTFVDPANPNATYHATALAAIGPVSLYEGLEDLWNLRGSYNSITAALGIPGLTSPTIVVDEAYNFLSELGAWPLGLARPNLTLRASGRPAWTVLNSAGAAPVLMITADNVTVDGFSLQNGALPSCIDVPVSQAGIVVRNCIIQPDSAPVGNGISFGADARGVIIENNNFILSDALLPVGPAVAVDILGAADGCRIAGNQVSAAGGFGFAAGFVLGTSCNAAEVSGNIIVNPAWLGIFFPGPADRTAILGNTVTGRPTAVGIYFAATATDSSLVWNALVGCLDGIALSGALPYEGLTISSNAALGCLDDGICVKFVPLTAPWPPVVSPPVLPVLPDVATTSGLLGVAITDNTVVGNGDGIVLLVLGGPASAVRDLTLGGNFVSGHSGPPAAGPVGTGPGRGITLDSVPGILTCENIVVAGNTLSGNFYGLQLGAIGSDITNAEVTGNTFDGNNVAILVGNPANMITQNDFLDSATFGVEAAGLLTALPLGNQVHAFGNWWGDPTGPRHSTNPAGLGDAVSDHVAFAPWATTSMMSTAIDISSPTIPATGTGQVVVSVTSDQVHDFQVGPVGKLTIAHSDKINVTGVVGVPPYEVSASNVHDANDGTAIEVTFAVNLIAGQFAAAGPVLALNITGTGAAGDTCAVTISSVDVFRDGIGNSIPYVVNSGVITLSTSGGLAKGDVNGDGAVDITDARWAAEAAIGIRTLTPAQFTAADVWPSPTGDGVVDVTDARWIAEYAIGLHPLSIAAARVEPKAGVGTATLALNASGQLVVSGTTAELADVQGKLVFDPLAMTVSEVVGVNGFTVLASAIDNAKGEVRFAAAKLSGGMVSSGPVIQFVAAGDVSQAVVDLDVLRDVHATNVPYEFVSGTKGALMSVGNYPNPVEDVHTTRFSVKATLPVDQIRVEIYDFSGNLLYDSGWGPNDLEWHLQNDAGDVLANGVYYYRILVQLVGQSEPVVSGLQKLAIYR